MTVSTHHLDYADPRKRGRADAYHRWLHRIALLTTAATFPLIFMGGLVTSHGAGMSVPDWPNSYGYNMFTFPPSQWVGGIFYEHTHRLMGTVVGMLAIALTPEWRRYLPVDVTKVGRHGPVSGGRTICSLAAAVREEVASGCETGRLYAESLSLSLLSYALGRVPVQGDRGRLVAQRPAG